MADHVNHALAKRAARFASALPACIMGTHLLPLPGSPMSTTAHRAGATRARLAATAGSSPIRDICIWRFKIS